MKAYEKWWKEEYDEPRYDDNSLRYAISKTGWKAALRWVKSHSQVAKNLYMIDVNDIDEELKDEPTKK